MIDYPEVSRKEFQAAIEEGINYYSMFHPNEAEQLREVGRTATLTVVGSMEASIDSDTVCGCPLVQSGVVAAYEPEYNTIGFWVTFDNRMRNAVEHYLHEESIARWNSHIVRITDD